MNVRLGIISVSLQCRLPLQCWGTPVACFVCTGAFLVLKYLKVIAEETSLSLTVSLAFPDRAEAAPSKDSASSCKPVFSYFVRLFQHEQSALVSSSTCLITWQRQRLYPAHCSWQTCLPENLSFHHPGVVTKPLWQPLLLAADPCSSETLLNCPVYAAQL